MNISAVPQDGRFTFTADFNGKKIPVDARVSFMP